MKNIINIRYRRYLRPRYLRYLFGGLGPARHTLWLFASMFTSMGSMGAKKIPFKIPQIPLVVGCGLVALAMGCTTSPTTTVPPYTHYEPANAPDLTTTLNQTTNQYAHITRNTQSTPKTFNFVVDAGSNAIQNLYFIFSNGSNSVTTVSKLTKLSDASADSHDQSLHLLPPHAEDNFDFHNQQHIHTHHGDAGYIEHFSEDEYNKKHNIDTSVMDRSALERRRDGGDALLSANYIDYPDLSTLALVEGTTDTFFVPIGAEDHDIYNKYRATAQLVRSVGDKTLVLWVADNVYTGCKESCIDVLLEKDDLVEIANRFLKDGNDNDIYDWVTSLTGPEWGDLSSDAFIPHRYSCAGIDNANAYASASTCAATTRAACAWRSNQCSDATPDVDINCGAFSTQNTCTATTKDSGSWSTPIHILLYDIAEDISYRGGIVGYYWGYNNYSNRYLGSLNRPENPPISNEKLMFYVDAPLAKHNNPELVDRWRRIIYSTLAHEFQHMIHFYQRRIVRRQEDATWLNEFFSSMIEDLVAQRINATYTNDTNTENLLDDRGLYAPGPGDYPICYGRAYTFVRNSYWGISRWDNHYINYATNFAFGAYLSRNYFSNTQSFFQNAYENENSTNMPLILNSVQRAGGTITTDDQLIAQWGTAVLLSDTTNQDVGYRYNYGNNGLVTHGATLGSLNFYNYGRSAEGKCATNESPAIPGFRVFRSTEDMYYRNRNEQLGHSFSTVLASQNAIGKTRFKVTIPKDTSLSVVARRTSALVSYFPER